MKKRMQFKGALLDYLRLPVYLGCLMIIACALAFIRDFWAGIFVAVMLAAYLGLTLYITMRSRDTVINDLTAYACQYETVVKEMLTQLDVPYVIIDGRGNMVWANDRFAALTGRDAFDSRGISQIFPDLDMKELYAKVEGGESVSPVLSFQEKIYRVWMQRIDLSEALKGADFLEGKVSAAEQLWGVYFYDETELLECQKQIRDDALVVGLAYLDNYEEVLESVEEVRRALLIALVDRKVNKYFADVDGLVRKMEKDKYFLVLKHSSLERLQEQRFHILEEVKAINIGNSSSVTLSLGLGTGGASMKQNSEYAQVAIEMALGRGGDQVVVKERSEISYWGGKSLSPEKTTRVKARMKAQALKEIMEQKERVVVMGHKITDVDALGAGIGIARAAMTIGKPVSIVVNDPTTSIRPLMEGFMDNAEYPSDMFVGSTEATSLTDENTCVIVVDTNKPNYTECPELLSLTHTVVVLDHHRRGNEVVENAVLSYVEPYASSTCEMVSEILQYFAEGLRLRSLEADCLYAGIVIDTNNFITRSGVRTFEAAAYLRRNGADITRVRKMLRDNIDSYKAKAEAVRTAEIYRDYFAISICPSEGLESPTVVGAQAANELLNIAGVKASFVMTSYHEEIFVSARAIDEVNVQVLMEQLGGGGHLNVAGAQMKTSLEEARESLKAIIDQFMDEGGLKK
ncbi:MAG: DHH family phosphoesterase [Blautia sp.]|nr:DHH family phosphoesterase [Blautia sp.]